MNIRKSLYIGLLLIAAMALGACGGGGGGSSLATGGFNKTLDTGSASWFGSLFGITTENRYQMLALASAINGSGNISSLSFKYQNDEGAATTCSDVTIKIGHTTVATLGTTYANNVETGAGGMITVMTNASITIPAGLAGEFFTVDVANDFNYNGVDNLIIELSRLSACDAPVQVRDRPESYLSTMFHISSATALTGTTVATGLATKINFAGGDNKVDFITAPTGNIAPLSANTAIQKIQMLYNASSIDGNGPITGIGLQINALTSANTYTYTMKLGHTSFTDLVATYVNNFNVGSPVTVANSVSFTVPAGVPAGEMIWLPIPDGVFTYNGTNNLVIELTIEAGSGTTTLATHTTTNINRIHGNPADADAATLTSYTHQIALRFNGGTMDVITDGGEGYIFPVGDANEFILQTLYDSTALGTGGQITELRFRLDSDSNAFDHTDVNLVLGHTTLSTLGAGSLAANIESDRTAVFSGTISIPAGLKAGDWITVPLSTTFIYDPTMNLVVQWDIPGFATLNYSRGHTISSGRYVNHLQANLGDRTSDVSSIGADTVVDLSLTISK